MRHRSLKATILATALVSGCAASAPSRLQDASGERTIFAAGAASCHAGLGGYYLGCDAFSAQLAAPLVTQPTRDLLMLTQMRYTYDFRFRCQTASPLFAALTLNGVDHRIPVSRDGAITTITVDLPLAEAAHAELRIPAHSYSIDPACTLTLVTLTAIPRLDGIRRLVDYLAAQLARYTAIYAELRSDATPAQVVAAGRGALELLSARLARSVDDWQEEATRAQPEPLRLRALCKTIRDLWEIAGGLDEAGAVDLDAYASLPAAQRRRLEVECLTIDGSVHEGSLRSSLRQLADCGAEAAACDAAQTGVRARLVDGRDTVAGDLQAIVDFLGAERQRLAASVAAFVAEATTLVQRVRSALQ